MKSGKSQGIVIAEVFSKARTVGTDFKEPTEEEDVVVIGTVTYVDSRNLASCNRRDGGKIG